ncbi:hypothetical protein K493DRAFT_336818 [Basidiobolus meristosporus CBS 931.73]|uniref:PWWP domain-containing protein n=1 Tax=Basidiobolus meristosporus CBS 931.73 TaxID=1314790 RepID=A0A1Y1YF47_9FUNG|nr:hypothetical protein K493DRAFT_336818 [Basidiobolus meristosporus CBS 931.73]|eukprot:ORX96661.1 hypothetical protein K493DRAFT_336818 [Basidiobolus meristosporus CBS 931.73]
MTFVSHSRVSSFSSSQNISKQDPACEVDSKSSIDQKRAFSKRKVVFVDPDDLNAPYWWPAMIVPEREIEAFKQTMENDIQEPGKGEHLVCYFEDGSFSIVPETEIAPFSPVLPPYTNYLRGVNADAFLNDKAVMLATLYWETGIVPPTFTWVRDEEQYTNASVLPLAELVTADPFPTLSTGINYQAAQYSTDSKKLTLETQDNHAGDKLNSEALATPSKVFNNQKISETKVKSAQRRNKSPPHFALKNRPIREDQTGNPGAPKNRMLWDRQDNSLSSVSVIPSSTSSSASFSDVVSPLCGLFTMESCTHCGEQTSTRITKVLCTECSNVLNDCSDNALSFQGSAHSSYCGKRARDDTQHESVHGPSTEFSILADILPRGRKQRLLHHFRSGLVPYC